MKQSGILINGARGEASADSDDFFEMANLFSEYTGLPFVVWIS